MKTLKTDPEREDLTEHTGIYVRAQNAEGAWDSVDIAELDAVSLLSWLRSRDGKNPWAENVVLILLGHGNVSVQDLEERMTDG